MGTWKSCHKILRGKKEKKINSVNDPEIFLMEQLKYSKPGS